MLAIIKGIPVCHSLEVPSPVYYPIGPHLKFPGKASFPVCCGCWTDSELSFRRETLSSISENKGLQLFNIGAAFGYNTVWTKSLGNMRYMRYFKKLWYILVVKLKKTAHVLKKDGRGLQHLWLFSKHWMSRKWSISQNDKLPVHWR